MRKVLVIAGATLCSLIFLFAQEPLRGISRQSQAIGPMASLAGGNPRATDDHNDNGPIQVGYAVVTPVGFNTNNPSPLVVFETFGLRDKSQNTTQAGVLPPGLTTNALLFVDTEGALSKNLGVAIVNPNSTNENVTLTLRGADGKTLGQSTTISVAAHQQTSKFVTELFDKQSNIPKDLTGTLSITSTDPISVIGLRFRGSNFSTLPVTSLSGATTLPVIAPNVGGAGAVLLPQFAAGGGWATELVIVNSGTSDMSVRVDLFKQDGTLLSTAMNNQPSASSFSSIVIPSGGVFVLAPRDANGADDF